MCAVIQNAKQYWVLPIQSYFIQDKCVNKNTKSYSWKKKTQLITNMCLHIYIWQTTNTLVVI